MKPSSSSSAADREIVITRIFDAPRQLVWRAWTDPELLARWWGPRGFTNPVCDWPAQAGRKIHVVMRAPNGTDYPMGGTFRELIAPEKIVFTTGALDAQGKMMFEFLHTLTLADEKGKTAMTLRSRIIATTPGAENYTNGFEAGMTQSLERLAELPEVAADREIVHTRVFHAPRELVWRAMTDPQLVGRWWGPRGFTTTIEKMDVRPGGVWQHVMRGPDGTNFPNKSVFKEVIPLERIVYSHGGGREDGAAAGANFTATWTFDALSPKLTRLTGRMVFASRAARDLVVREYGAVEGAKQTFERLSEHLAGERTAPFVISREFAAPRALVWQAWTDRERLMQWFGPKDFKMPFAKMDFQPGGMFLYNLVAPNGATLWGKFVFREIAPPDKLVWVNSFSDPDGGTTRHPFTTDPWPRQLLTIVTFAENAGKTTVTVHWLPLDATDEEIQTFDAGRGSMAQGWGGTMEQLKDYVAKP